mmetsp:Transcript_17067/g.49478  ORF Transcript_17067/g.49478 Transcript_17067/m.49478 type:complete len:292 (-) Transcript_17067:73-948(-)
MPTPGMREQLCRGQQLPVPEYLQQSLRLEEPVRPQLLRGSPRGTHAPGSMPDRRTEAQPPPPPVPQWVGGSAARRSEVGGGGDERDRSDVQLHIYHCDAVTGFLNNTVLLRAEIPIYHVGVELFGREWAFQYYENAWHDDSISGVHSCAPKRAPGYEYVRSVNLGPTPLSEPEALLLIAALRREWPASSYHITRRNCVTFAQTLAATLQVTTPFPPWLRAILDASSNNAAADAILDYSWTFSKWWMARSGPHAGRGATDAPAAGERRPLGCLRMGDLMDYAGCTSIVKAAN